MATFGKAEDVDDDAVLEGVHLWRGRLDDFTRDGEVDAAKTARDALAEFEAEAK
jgi:hypothetical protein